MNPIIAAWQCAAKGAVTAAYDASDRGEKNSNRYRKRALASTDAWSVGQREDQ